jgi:uncharacterized protein YidB (DUF937 family)
MGLLDIINGMQHGPHGQPQPASAGGGMSKVTMALIGILAYKALKSLGDAQPAQPGSAPRPGSPNPEGTSAAAPGGGTLGDMLGNILGGLFGGGARLGGGLPGGAEPGSVLSRGIGNLVQDLQQRGFGAAVQSWIGNGPNHEISPDKLESALGGDALDTLTKQTGMNRDELLAALSQYLPRVIDHLTPHGRLPTEEEISRIV